MLHNCHPWLKDNANVLRNIVFIRPSKNKYMVFHPNNQLNPYHVEFLQRNNPPYIFGSVHYHFKRYQNKNLKLVSQQYRAWSDCTDVQAGLALYWWQRLKPLSALTG